MVDTIDTEGHDKAARHVGTAMTGARPAPRRAMRLVRFAALLAILGLALYAAGFALYLGEVSQYRAQAPERRADGIVVLTGGYARIDEAMRLLDDEMGERLLISGVHPSASRAVLAKTFAADGDRFSCCVDIDREALDTVGNAVETAEWATAHGYGSLLVVTNDYHMPRSLLELHSALGGIELIPHAVVSSQHTDVAAGDRASRYRVLFGEYVKYSAARVRTLIAPRLGPDEAVRKATLTSSNR